MQLELKQLNVVFKINFKCMFETLLQTFSYQFSMHIFRDTKTMFKPYSACGGGDFKISEYG